MVTRIHGKNTRVLVNGTPLGSVNEVNINRTPDRADTTSFGDGNKTSVKGFDEATVEFRGFYDLDDTALKAARTATGGAMVAVYPNYPTDLTKFWGCICDLDFSYASTATAAQTINGTAWAKATATDNL
jgi:hypothetical protein